VESLFWLLGGYAIGLLFIGLAVRWREVLAGFVLVANALLSFFRVVRGKPILFVALAVFLVAVPTATGLFPGHVLNMPKSQRVEIGAVWLIAAVIAAIASRAQDSKADERDKAIEATMSGMIRGQMREQFQRILDASGIPKSYRYSIYFKVEDKLHPFFPNAIENPSDPRVFDLGKGVVGVSFENDAPYALVGEDVSGDGSGLSLSQKAYFRNDKIVAAVPIRRFVPTGNSTASTAIGVLSVIGAENDGTYMLENKTPVETGMAQLRGLAVDLAVAADGYSETMMKA